MPGGLDAATLRRAMRLALDGFVAHESSINSLNVYPVPDGDTGTNLRLTQEAVVDALRSADEAADEPADRGGASLGDTIARAALMGARGNSGVILSQILRAFAQSVADGSTGDPTGIAASLRRASDEADAAVGSPVEGTILTVMHAAADGASAASTAGGAVVDVLRSALTAARAALARTPEQLPELAAAGVVDAGGKGAVVLLDALLAAVIGEPRSEPLEPAGPIGRASGRPESDPSRVLRHPFEVQMLVAPSGGGGAARLRDRLARLGESVVVVGGPELLTAHVHTAHPDDAVAAASELGDVRARSVVDLRVADPHVEGGGAGVERPDVRCAVVAVAEGRGLEETFRSLGATVARGGPGNNPAVGDIVAAIERSGGRQVLVLPNHRNIIPAARLAAGIARGDVRVVETRSVPAGIAALTAFDVSADAEENERSMAKAARDVRGGAIVPAERDARTPLGEVRAGQWLGLVEDEPVVAGRSLRETAAAVGRALVPEDAELATVILGAGVDGGDRADVVEALERIRDGVRVEVVDGGQPGIPFLIGVE